MRSPGSAAAAAGTRASGHEVPTLAFAPTAPVGFFKKIVIIMLQLNSWFCVLGEKK